MALVLAPATASACSCIAAHPATKLAQSERALVGVVESRTPTAAPPGISAGWDYVVRVERMLKGVAAERVTLRSGITSCQITLEVGQRVGLTHIGSDQQIFSCGYVDPDELLAAAALPVPSGSARYEVALDGVPGTDAVQLGADGKVAGYGFPRGEVLAQGRCTSRSLVQAVRGEDGKIRFGFGAVELPLRDVAGVGCTENGRRQWVVGSDGTQMRLLSVRNGTLEERTRRRADAAAIADGRAYFASRGVVRVVTLAGGKSRSARVKGGFVSLSGNGDRVAGRLRDGRAAVLNVRTGKLVTGPESRRLTWIDDTRLLGADAVYDARLRRLRGVTTRGTFVGAAGGAAFFADGKVLYRLAPGARRAVRLAELPGRVTSVIPAPRARAAAALCTAL